MQKILGEMRAAMERYEMIPAGSRVAVGVSGGKDSLVLLCGLAKLRRFYPKPFEVVALTADPCFGGIETDFTPVAALCARLGVDYRIRRTRLGTIIFEERREKNPCALCARMRRGILHKMAKEEDCDTLALGHHSDDAVQTFYMNLLYGGRIGCFSPVSYLSRRSLRVIRPLIYTREREIRACADRLSLPVAKSGCPADGDTARRAVEEWIAAQERLFSDFRAKTIGAMERASLNGWGAAGPFSLAANAARPPVSCIKREP